MHARFRVRACVVACDACGGAWGSLDMRSTSHIQTSRITHMDTAQQIRSDHASHTYHVTSNHIASYHMYHIISYRIISHHITSYHITSHPLTSHHITSHHITSHHMTPIRHATHAPCTCAICDPRFGSDLRLDLMDGDVAATYSTIRGVMRSGTASIARSPVSGRM